MLLWFRVFSIGRNQNFVAVVKFDEAAMSWVCELCICGSVGHGQREESCTRYVITSSPTPLVRTCEHQYGGTYSNFVFFKREKGNKL